jgi:hypothetical protein
MEHKIRRKLREQVAASANLGYDWLTLTNKILPHRKYLDHALFELRHIINAPQHS